MPETQRDRLAHAISTWLTNLEAYPGWTEWRRDRFAHTLYFDDRLPPRPEMSRSHFEFSDEVEKQHSVVIQYLGLAQTIESLKECEFYFRRYPFRGLPVIRYNHVTNICEMYFGRFYEFKERLKQYFKALALAAPEHRLDVGPFVKQFEKISIGSCARATKFIITNASRTSRSTTFF